VVAEKAGVKLSPAMLAASSRQGGGGERARLPATTATDQEGRVQGFQGGSYARKNLRQPGSAGAPARPAMPMPAAPQPAAPAPMAAPAPAPAAAPPRAGAMRFSSLSGFRRR
jgi:hypothetical protein